MAFLNQNASTVITYWFIDCMYIDQTTDMMLNYTYNDTKDHTLDVLVVANNEPLPPLTTTTTTTTTTSTTTTTTTTTTPKPSSTVPPAQNATGLAVSESTAHKIVKRNAKKALIRAEKDFICHNSGIVPIGDKYTYGHYQETISIRGEFWGFLLYRY